MAWQWQTDHGNWKCYDEYSQRALGLAHASNLQKIRLTIAGASMKINFKKLYQKNTLTDKKRPIRFLPGPHTHSTHCAPIIYSRRTFPTMAYSIPPTLSSPKADEAQSPSMSPSPVAQATNTKAKTTDMSGIPDPVAAAASAAAASGVNGILQVTSPITKPVPLSQLPPSQRSSLDGYAKLCSREVMMTNEDTQPLLRSSAITGI